QAVEALKLYHQKTRGEFIFSNHRRKEGPISRVQAWRIVRTAAQAVGAGDNIGCHSLRKTWGYHAWVDQNISPVVIMQIFNHSSFQVTKRYLGVEQDELNRAYLSMELF
ncbi:MAG: tyrosine-type recombinase/integrase, partial [Clostridia bacterium]|nr:tyrosine-type recombinase/integrase [Clostridia bacterium]